MATLVVAARALADIELLLQELRATAPGAAGRAASALRTALAALADHPLIGPRLDGDVRALVIACGPIGTVAAYRYVIPDDEIRVLAVCAQRGLGIAP